MLSCYQCAKQIEEVELLYARWLKPLDIDALLRSVDKTKRILVVENGLMHGGIGASVLAQISSLRPHAKCRLLGSTDSFLAGGDWGLAIQEAGVDEDTILAGIRSLVAS